MYVSMSLYVCMYVCICVCAYTHTVRCVDIQLGMQTTVQEYEAIARELDRVTGCETWKEDPRSSCYDWRRVKAWTKALRQYRGSGKIHKLCESISTMQHLKWARIFSEECFSHSHWGTKYAIEDFVHELAL